MTETDKTHYRKAFKSPYLSSADIVEPTALTIDSVVLLIDKTKKTKDHFNTAIFAEQEIRPGEKLKPMILNVGNSEVLRDMCGSPYIEDWKGAVTVYVDQNVRWGKDTVEGLRLRPGPAYISESQSADLRALIEEVEADEKAFLKWAGCDSIDKFPIVKHTDAVRMLQAKRQ